MFDGRKKANGACQHLSRRCYAHYFSMMGSGSAIETAPDDVYILENA